MNMMSALKGFEYLYQMYMHLFIVVFFIIYTLIIMYYNLSLWVFIGLLLEVILLGKHSP